MTGTWSPGPTATGGVDVYNGDGTDETADGLGGNDTLNGAGGSDTLTGGEGDDLIRPGDDFVDDTLTGGNGTDTLDYSNILEDGVIANVLFVDRALDSGTTDQFSGFEIFYGTESADRIIFGNSMLVYGGGGGDLIEAGNSVTAWGGAGGDIFRATSGFTIADFNVNEDRFVGDISAAVVDGSDTLLTLSTHTVRIVGVTGLTLAQWQALTTANFDVDIHSFAAEDTNIGNSGLANLTWGGDGNDTLHGHELADWLIGGRGNDTFFGGAGNDYLEGGSGTDTADYSNAVAGVQVNLTLTVAQNTVGAGADTLVGIENLTGSALADVLTGNTQNNILIGGAGMDQLRGGVGADTLNGGDDNDALRPGNDYDVDTIDGGGGWDYVDLSDATEDGFIAHLGVLYRGVGAGIGDTYTNVDEIVGSSANDRILAPEHGRGGAGDDLMLFDGADLLFGDAGRDVFGMLAVTSGGQIGDFEIGVDYFLTTIASAVVDGADTLLTFTGGGSVRVLNINTLTLAEWQAHALATTYTDSSNSAISNSGTAGVNWAFLDGGNDTYNALAGDDMVSGGMGDDTLNGGDGHDRMKAAPATTR